MENTFDKEAYKAKKKEELDQAYDYLNEATNEIKGSVDSYVKYLDVQSHFDRYSVSNALLVFKQCPDAVQLKPFDVWKGQNVAVNKGEKGISLLEPRKFTGKDGTEKTAYGVRKLFDRTQTSATSFRRGEFKCENPKNLLVALVKEPPCQVEPVSTMDGESLALYSRGNNKIYVKRGLEAEVFFKEVTHELAHAMLAKDNPAYKRENYEEKAKAISYLLGRKYGMTAEAPKNVPEEWESMTEKEVRADLNTVRNAYSRLHESIYAALEKMKAKEEREER